MTHQQLYYLLYHRAQQFPACILIQHNPKIKKIQKFPNLFKALNQSRGRTEEEGKVNNNKSKTPIQFRYKRSNTPVRIPIIIITPKLIQVNLEVGDHTEPKIPVNFSEVKISVVEASEITMHTKAIIKAPIIKAITTNVITVSTIIHMEVIIKTIVRANLEAGVIVM